MTVYAEREGFVRLDLETTYGTDPGTDVNLYVEEATIDANRIMLERNGPSPYRKGAPPIVGPQDVSWTIKAEMVPVTMADPPVERPPEDPILKMCQFLPTQSAGAADPDVVTYALQSNHEGVASGSESSATLTIVEFNSDDDDGWFRKAKGSRGTLAFDITPGERWYLTANGVSKSFKNTSIGDARDSEPLSYDFDTDPAVAGEGECLVTSVTNAEAYPATGRVVSFSCSVNNNATVVRGVCGQKARNFGERVTASLVLEVQDAGDFDPWQYQGQDSETRVLADAILVQIGNAALSFTSAGVPTVAGDYILFRGYFFINKISLGGDADAKTWTLDLVGAYAPISSFTAGEDPSEGIVNFLYGTKG